MLTRLVRQPLTWLTLLVSVLMALLMTFSYLGAFLSPAENTHNLPLGIVNADHGGAGQQVVSRLTTAAPGTPDTYQWSVLPSRDAALAAINADSVDAVIVIGANYSASLANLTAAQSTPPMPVQIEILTNPAAGTIAASQAQAAATAVVGMLSTNASTQLIQHLTAAGATLAPQMAGVVANPVQPLIVPAVQVGAHSARGLSAFYFALMLGLVGFIGTNIVGMVFDMDAEARRRNGQQVPQIRIFVAKAVFYTLMAVAGGLAVTGMASGLLGMDTPDPIGLSLFAILGVVAVAAVSLFFQMAFGRAGLLLGLLVFTILGVPASGGPYAFQMVPSFWQMLHAWVPLRYLTDGTRALLFLNGNSAAGMDQAVLVMVAYAVGGFALAATSAYIRDRFAARTVRAGAVESASLQAQAA